MAAALGFAAAVPTPAVAATPGGNGELSYTVRGLTAEGHPSGSFLYEPYSGTETALPTGGDHSWAPAGEALVHATPQGIALHRLADPGNDVMLTRNPGDADPTISSDGREIAFERDGKIWVVGIGGGEARPLVDGIDPVFKPYAHEVAYATAAGISAVPTDGSRAPELLLEPTVEGATLSRPEWMPQNRYVVAQQDAAGKWTMPIKDLISESVEVVDPGSAPGCERAPIPAGAPASQRIAYVKGVATESGCEERIEVLHFTEVGDVWVIGEVAGRTSSYEHLAWRPTDRQPVALIQVGPEAPLTGDPVTFTLTDVGDPDDGDDRFTWDLDGDGFDDGSESQVTTTFATAGTHTVKLQIIDNHGKPVVFQSSVVVGERAPVATVPVSPAPPVTQPHSGTTQPGGGVTPTGGGTTAQPATRSPLVVRLAPVQLKSVLRRSLPVDVTLAGRGTVTATARPIKRTARRLGRSGTIATAKARFAAGGTKALELRFDRRTRTVLARERVVTLEVRVVAVDAAGTQSVVTRRVTLRP